MITFKYLDVDIGFGELFCFDRVAEDCPKIGDLRADV